MAFLFHSKPALSFLLCTSKRNFIYLFLYFPQSKLCELGVGIKQSSGVGEEQLCHVSRSVFTTLSGTGEDCWGVQDQELAWVILVGLFQPRIL